MYLLLPIMLHSLLPKTLHRYCHFCCTLNCQKLCILIYRLQGYFERYQGGSRNGLICLVESSSFEHSDFGANYTIKEYSSKKTITEEGWQHQEIILLPKSTDDSYSPIVLKDEETIDLQVVGIFKMVL